MQRPISYVLVYEDPTYNKNEDDPKTSKMDSLRRRFVVAMRKEGLNTSDERVGKHIFLKVSCEPEILYQEAEIMRLELPLNGLILTNPEEMEEAMIERRMKRLFSAHDSNNKISAPFQTDCMEFFTSRAGDECPVFWSSMRVLLIYDILNKINISRFEENGELPEKIGLSYLLMVGAFKDGFCLHDPSEREPVSLPDTSDSNIICDPRKSLSKRWGGLCRQQPIHRIRDYFGEKIAFYFAWVSTYISSLWIPAVLGIGVFAYGIVDRLRELEEKDVGHFIEVLKSCSDNDLTPAFAAIICLWGTIFMEVWKRKQISLARQWYVDNFDRVEPDRPQFKGTSGHLNQFTKQFVKHYPFRKKLVKYTLSFSVLMVMVMLVFISVTSVILYRVYMTITFCGNDSTCDLLHGTILATLLNTISIMVLGRIYEAIAEKLTEWENHQTQSEHNDALVIKLFVFQFANTYASLFYTAFFRRDFGSETGILGLDKKYTDFCGHVDNDNCMSLLSFQLLVLMIVKPMPKFAKDVIWPLIKKATHNCRLNEIDDFTTDEGVSKQNYLLREMHKPAAEDFRLGEFTEKMIQYGYLVLFAASFPLAPALALIFNIIDLRIDAKRLLWWNRRPVPYRDNDIGIWFHIINFINIFGVISNAFLIAFNSELGRNESLYVKFAIIIGFEHFIFFMKFAISLLIPDVPTWVINSQKKERYLLSHLMKKQKQKIVSSKTDLRQCYPNLQESNGDIVVNELENLAGGNMLKRSSWSY